MAKKTLATVGVFLAFVMAAAAFGFGGAPEQTFRRGIAVRLGPGIGLFSRTVDWKNGTAATRLSAVAVMLDSELALPRRLTVNVFAGMSFSDFKGAAFLNLPFSLEYQAGAIKGFLAGAEIRKGLLSFGDFELRAAAHFVSTMGFKKTWPLEGFAIQGEVRGTPHWSQWTIGPEISYLGFRGLTPFMGVSLSWLRGKFEMSEAVGGLRGSQTLRIREKDLLRIAAGVFSDIGRRLCLRGEIVFVPSSGHLNAGASLKVLYAF